MSGVGEHFSCAGALSAHPDAAVAVGEVVGAVLERLDPHPDVAVLFVSGALIAPLEQIVAAVKALLAPELLIGTTVEAVFDSHGGSVDGLALWALSSASTVGVEPVRLTATPTGAIQGLPPTIATGTALMAFGDGAFPVEELAAELRARSDDPSVMVGLPPSRGLPQRFALIDNDGFHRSGAVGLLVPAQAAAMFGFEVRLWDEDDPIPDPPIQPTGGRGAVLVAGRRVDVSGVASFDLEVLYDQMAGAVIGMIGRPHLLDGSDPDRQLARGANCVTAAVYGR